jgi:hypothetical protein
VAALHGRLAGRASDRCDCSVSQRWRLVYRTVAVVLGLVLLASLTIQKYAVVVDGILLAVDGVPDYIDDETVLNAQVSRRDHDDAAVGTDTLEQISLAATLVVVLIGLLVHLLVSSQPTSANTEAETDEVDQQQFARSNSVAATNMAFVLTVMALLVAAAPIVATYWMYKHPGDTRLTLWLALPELHPSSS